jgi:phospholipid transport system substrate-binding protein
MFKKIILFFIITFSFLYGVEESKIKSTMEEKTGLITAILKKNSLSKQQKEDKIVLIVEELFNYNTMAMISLGKRWKSLSRTKQVKFIHAFKKKLQQSYFDKLELYTDQKIVIANPTKVKSNRIMLKSDIISKDETYEVVYKFYKAKGDHWLIYDVNLAGVSIIQSYRKQFDDYLKTKSLDQLIQSL